MPRLAFLASGSGSTFEAAVRASQRGALAADVVLLITSRAGVGAAEQADRLGVEHVVLDEKAIGRDECDARMRSTLEEHHVDLVVLAGFLRKIGPRTLEAFKGRIINTHPAPLPRFGGQGMYGERVHQAVLDAGVSSTAATVHWADADYDTGAVIAVEKIPVFGSDDVPSLRARVQAVEKDLLIQTINRLLRARAAPPGARGARARE
jgi:phosphoribosylglycinamide formyltransferase-1